MEKLLKRLMEHFSWKRVAIIASTDDIWQIAANLVKIELLRHGISVAHFHSFIPGRLHILESRIVRHAELIQKAAKRAMSKLMYIVTEDLSTLTSEKFENGASFRPTVHTEPSRK